MKKVIIVIGLILCSGFVYAFNIDADKTKGCDSLTVKFGFTDTTSINAVKFAWDFGNGDTSTKQFPPAITFDSVGIYNVKLTINDTSSNTLKIEVRKKPLIGIYFADSLAIGSFNYYFRKTPVHDSIHHTVYTWTFSDGTTTSDTLPETEHKFPSEGSYEINLKILDDAGCEAVAVANVNVQERIYVPNVFSPNDDGVNDLYIIESDGVTMLNFKVFSRSGVKVYEKTGLVITWDGRTNAGTKLKPGVYYYILAPEVDGKIQYEQKGNLYLY